MPCVQRGLTQQQHNTAAFFQADICRPGDQVVRHASGKRAHGLDRTRSDDHALAFERSTGNGRPDILAIVNHVGEIVHIVSGVFRLDQHDAHSGRRHDEMGFNALYLL